MIYIILTVVVIAVIAFFVFAPERCKNCSGKLQKIRYRWVIGGKEADVCGGCHTAFQINRPANVRAVRRQEEEQG